VITDREVKDSAERVFTQGETLYLALMEFIVRVTSHEEMSSDFLRGELFRLREENDKLRGEIGCSGARGQAMSTEAEQDYRKSLCLHGIPRERCRVCDLEGELTRISTALGMTVGIEKLSLIVTAKVESLRLVEAENKRLRAELERWKQGAVTRLEADADLG
jgi:hypothetical protein